jgi:alcohol dehydrogenase
MMLNDWEILGQFMYPAGAYRRLLDLARDGFLNFRTITARTFALDALPEAMDAAAQADAFECIVVAPQPRAASVAAPIGNS